MHLAPLHTASNTLEVEMFNTLKYTKQLEEAGIAREQAEAHIQIIAEIIEVDVATKNDLRDLEYRLIIKLSAILGTIVTVAIAITSTLVKFF